MSHVRLVLPFRQVSISLGLAGLIGFTPVAQAAPFTLARQLTSPVQLTKDVEGSFWPRFSPDGGRILYYSKIKGLRQLFVQNVSGGARRQLTQDNSDNRDPSWSPDGRHIVWSKKKLGGNYDVWIMKADGSGSRQLTHSKASELRPRLSPVTFKLTPEGAEPADPIFGGVGGPSFGPYQRILYQRGEGKHASIWSMWDDGRFPRQVSPRGLRARHAEWAPDGMSIAYDVETSNGSVIYIGKSTKSTKVHPYVERKGQMNNEQLLQKLPKEFITYPARAITRPGDNYSRPAFFANNTGLFAVKADRGNKASFDIHAIDLKTGSGQPAVSSDGMVFAPTWSPVGDKVAFTAFVKDISQVFVADSGFYLSDVINLYRYPEILSKPSDKLAKNRFVIRLNEEKEFFHLLEKVRYQKKGVFVSTDPLMQLYHDMFESILMQIEKNGIYADLQKITEKMSFTANRRYGINKGKAREMWGKLAVYFAVPLSILKAEGNGIAPVQLPPPLKAQWKQRVEAIQAHAGTIDGVDFTQFKVRGHYDDKGKLSAYFRAMMWYGIAPLGDAVSYGTVYAHLRNTGMINLWNKIYRVTSYFAGEAEDPSFADLQQAEKKNPALMKQPPAKTAATVFRNAKSNRIADVAVKSALVDGKGAAGFAKKYRFMPQRYSLDADILQSVVAPRIPGRGMASSLDVMSALGSDRALEHLYQPRTGEPGAVGDKARHRNAIESLRATVKGKPPAYWNKNLYNGWLYAMQLMQRPPAVPAGIPGGKLPEFARQPEWLDKQLISTAASYTELKHDTILYSKQPYAAEGAEGGELVFFLEHVIEKEPRGYVEPAIELYRWLKALTTRTASLVKRTGYIDDEEDYRGQVGPMLEKAGGLMSDLEALAVKQLGNKPLSDDDYRKIDRFGAVLESYYVAGGYGGGAPMTRSGDRLENGIKLVADVLTSLNSGKVLEQAVGDVYSLYVITPHADGKRLNQGGVFSYFEFQQPMTERMSDKEWAQQVGSGKAPPMPSWTRGIVEAP